MKIPSSKQQKKKKEKRPRSLCLTGKKKNITPIIPRAFSFIIILNLSYFRHQSFLLLLLLLLLPPSHRIESRARAVAGRQVSRIFLSHLIALCFIIFTLFARFTVGIFLYSTAHAFFSLSFSLIN